MKHVLIIDDQQDHAFLIQKQLVRLGFLTSVCVDIFQVLNRIKNGYVDVVTIDLNMPFMDGVEVIKHIRNLDREIPIIVITATNNEFKRIECLQHGADYYLVKPFYDKELKAIMEQYQT